MMRRRRTAKIGVGVSLLAAMTLGPATERAHAQRRDTFVPAGKDVEQAVRLMLTETPSVDRPGRAVYRVDGPGSIARILTATDLQEPNGIQVSPDAKTLYVVESSQAKK